MVSTMPPVTQHIDHLRDSERCGYGATGTWAAEPTALACLALRAHDEPTAALRLAQQLADAQQSDGVVPATTDEDFAAVDDQSRDACMDGL